MDTRIITPETLTAEDSAPEPFSISTQKSSGSGFIKHQRSTSLLETWQPTKIPKSDSFYIGQSLGSLRSGSGFSGNNGQPSMICFSSQPQFSHFSDADCDKSSTLPFFICSPKPTTTSYYAEKSDTSIHGPFSKFRGPFTPSQWMELEHQAMIYKHFISNIPVPSHLLIPLKRAFNPYSSFSNSGPYASNSLGWGPFRVGFGGSSDPEPGRCRRTDGKKWRCARDAVHDQKYCERHLNRGRHRSRKPVEGQLGHANSVSSALKVPTNDIMMPTNKVSNTFGALHHQLKTLQPISNISSCDPLTIRLHDLQALQAEETPLFEGSVSDFGLVSPDSLLNPSERISCRNPDSLFRLNDQEGHDDQYPLRHFIDNWPKDQSNQPSSWTEELKLDWTQLSMSIPESASDFSTTQSSLQMQESKISTKMEVDCINEPKQNHMNWLSWGEDSVGGPLGEALNSGSNSNIGESLKISSNTWDNNNNNPQFGFSPTGVLQKSMFLSRSSSCSGNSPGAGNNKAN